MIIIFLRAQLLLHIAAAAAAGGQVVGAASIPVLV